LKSPFNCLKVLNNFAQFVWLFRMRSDLYGKYLFKRPQVVRAVWCCDGHMVSISLLVQLIRSHVPMS
jgi:hypothetical protein